jgi:uncharacterized membrane protein
MENTPENNPVSTSTDTPPTNTPATEKKEENTSPVTQEEKKYAALAYLPGMAPIAFQKEKESEFIQFHAKQAIIVNLIFFFAIMFMAAFGGMFLLNMLLMIAVISLITLGYMSADVGKKTVLPLVSVISEKLKI